jgi:hypothetical protein
MVKLEINKGDVFSIPITDALFGLGQIVFAYTEGGADDAYYMAIFGETATTLDNLDVASVVRGRPLLLALSFDAKIYSGQWEIIGNYPVSSDLPLPAVKIRRSGTMYVVDYSGSRSRVASEREAALLSYRTYVSPQLLVEALRAKLGFEEWQQRFDEYVPSGSMTSAQIFGDNLEESSASDLDESRSDDNPETEQSVFVYFDLDGDGYGTKDQRDAIFEVEEELENELRGTNVGTIDGNEFGGGKAVLFAYGPDANVLLEIIRPSLEAAPLRPSYIELRRGGPDQVPRQIAF